MASSTLELGFPCSLTISVPFPSHRLASSALRALQVDAELSSLVCRSFSVDQVEATTNGSEPATQITTILHVQYRATTNRMLRVAVNGFMESLGLVLRIMEELDVDVWKPSDSGSITASDSK